MIVEMENTNQIPNVLYTILQQQYCNEDIEKIVNGYKCVRNTTFRVNTLKASVEKIVEEFKNNNIQIENVEWSKTSFIVKNASENKIQNLECYKNGEIYVQSLSSMLPPLILNPKKDENILDMTAAPGSKTTEIAMLCNNEALITACEINKIRLERLKYNIEKQGAKRNICNECRCKETR